VNVKQFLFYTRPVDMHLHIALAQRISGDMPDIPIVFATFFRRTFCMLRDQGYEVTYLPEALRAARTQDCSQEMLNRIEAEALEGSGGANLQLMLQAERFLPPTAEAADRFLRAHVLVLDRLVRPGTWSIASMFDHFVYWLAGSLANARGGRHYGLVGCAVPPNRTIMLRTPWEAWRVPVEEAEAVRLLELSKQSQSLPMHERIAYMTSRPVRPPRPKGYYRDLLRDMRHDRLAKSYFALSPLLPLKWGAEKALPGFLYRALFSNPEPRYDIMRSEEVAAVEEPYVYFPLHMEPEATLLMYSPWCRDQIEAARLTSQALPVGWKLLIKENPKMRGKRPMSYYHRLRALPNALLVDPSVSSGELAKCARSTVSIAGNASVEAVLLGRPGICLGRPPFRDLLTAADISSRHELASLFNYLREIDQQNVSIPGEAWKRWVSGTVDVSLPLISFDTEIGFPDDPAVAEGLWRHICRTMTIPGDTQT
jgi:hypothetical protein